MALTKAEITRAAGRLRQAEHRSRMRRLSQDHPDFSMADSYAIQKAWIDIKLDKGRVIRDHKIGLTSKAMRKGDAIQAVYGAYGSVSCYFA